MDYLLSPGQLAFFCRLAGFIAAAYYFQVWRKTRGRITLGSIIRLFVLYNLLVTGAIGCYQGFVLAVREEYREQDGRVVAGVVVEKLHGLHRGLLETSSGQRFHAGDGRFQSTEGLARWLVYGSPAPRYVDYQYSCAVGPQGRCFGRDAVAPALWDRLQIGSPVNVRQATNENKHARLDQNPQRALALAQLAVSAMFLLAAAVVSGRIRLWPSRPKYLYVPAVVLAVEEVQYRDAKRWKVRFGYYDGQGHAQESADEVGQPVWKPGDDCIAVYRPNSPDLATLQPARS
jgi:hypothetical protein